MDTLANGDSHERISDDGDGVRSLMWLLLLWGISHGKGRIFDYVSNKYVVSYFSSTKSAAHDSAT